MKRASNKILLTIIGLCMVPLAYGQSNDMNGQTFLQAQMNNFKWIAALRKRTDEIKPAYLFKEGYLLAELTSPTGKIITKNKFKLDMQDNRLYFLDSASEEMEVVNPVKKIIFVEQEGNNAAVSFEKGFPPIDKLNENNFYQVIVPGKALLLLDTKFNEVSRIEYPSGISVKTTEKLLNYYGSLGAVMVRITKAENVLELLSDKSKEIAAYMQRENIKVKKQSDLAKVFTYYNSLFP
jgi:hypothetical protein